MTMQPNIKDKSDFLKGLLVLAKKDRSLSDEEKIILKSAGNKYGFASEFIEESLFHLLQNRHISEEPIKFSDNEIAKNFLSEGLKLAFCDNENPISELSWLKQVAEINHIELKWLEKEISQFKKIKL
jgi:hypothetical protein